MLQPTGGWGLPLVALGAVVVLGGLAWVVLSRSEASTDETDDALAALKRRYVAGEIDEATYERRLETLFETETVADARAYAEREPRDREDPVVPAQTRREGAGTPTGTQIAEGSAESRAGSRQSSGGCGGSRRRSRHDAGGRRGC